MQEMAQDKELVEVAAIQPILEQIIADHSVINVARARAQQLLCRRMRTRRSSLQTPAIPTAVNSKPHSTMIPA